MLGRVVGTALEHISPFRVVEIQRQMRMPAAAPYRHIALVFVDHEPLQRDQQERSKTPSPGVGGPDALTLEEPCEEPLGQILSLVDVVAASAKVGVQRRPVDLTELRESRVGTRIR